MNPGLGIGPPQTHYGLIKRRSAVSGVSLWDASPEYPFLWKNATSRKNGTFEQFTGTGKFQKIMISRENGTFEKFACVFWGMYSGVKKTNMMDQAKQSQKISLIAFPIIYIKFEIFYIFYIVLHIYISPFPYLVFFNMKLRQSTSLA